MLAALLSLGMMAADVPPATAEDPCLIVVHASNPATAISREALSAIYLGQMTRWKDSRLIAAIDQSTRTAVRAAFSERFLRKPVVAVQLYWGQQISTGRGVPPAVKGSDEDVAAFVRANPAAIGYVSSTFALGDGLKALRVVD